MITQRHPLVILAAARMLGMCWRRPWPGSERPADREGGGGGELTADFQSIQDNVFTPIWYAECHAGAGAPEGLNLSAGNSYNLLVGIPSTPKFRACSASTPAIPPTVTSFRSSKGQRR